MYLFTYSYKTAVDNTQRFTLERYRPIKVKQM